MYAVLCVSKLIELRTSLGPMSCSYLILCWGAATLHPAYSRKIHRTRPGGLRYAARGPGYVAWVWEGPGIVQKLKTFVKTHQKL